MAESPQAQISNLTISVDQGAAAAEDASKKAFRNTCIAAFSNLSTAYNLVNINLAHVVMQNQYCGGDNCKGSVTTAGTACLVGAIAGQLTFGYVGDCIGRGPALRLTMMLSILGAFVSAFAVPITDEPESVFIFLSFTRLVLGVGVGGVYPLAATIAAESSGDEKRGRNASLVFSMQGVGTLTVPIVGMIFLYGFGNYPDRFAAGSSLPGISWRFILGVGAVPGILLLPFKAKDASRAAVTNGNTAPQGMTLSQALKTKRYWKNIIGCAGGWFLFDITFYGNTLFAPTVLQTVFGKADTKGYTPVIGDSLKDNLCLQLMILALIGLPGYYLSVCFMDSAGRKNIQLQGFCFMAFLYGILALFLDKMKGSSGLLLIIYGLTYFFSNFGPNSTTFILPSESFPAEVRASLNGFCAAMGKLGATLGSAIFKPIVDAGGPETVFWLCSACAVLGVLCTAFCVDDLRGRGMRGTSFMPDESGNNVIPASLDQSFP